jgi:hypothetical protein
MAGESGSELPLLVYDSILPLQCIPVQYDSDSWVGAMIEHVLKRHRLGHLDCTIAMVGQNPQTGSPSRVGTEVAIIDAHGGVGGKKRSVTLQGRRCFYIPEEAEAMPMRGPKTAAEEFRVIEVQWQQLDIACDGCGMDPLVGGRYKSQSVPNFDLCSGCHDTHQFHARYGPFRMISDANNNSSVSSNSGGDSSGNDRLAGGLEGLVQEWETIVVDGGHERVKDHIKQVRNDLGKMPPRSKPDQRSLWVAALINPLPGLGVAREIRPAVLAAQDTRERLEAVTMGIKTSIAHLDGTRPMW